MVAALYGELTPHPWRDRESEHDAYALFHERSLAMGWLDDRSAGGGSESQFLRAPGLWAMNDGAWAHPLADPAAGLVSWFQVEASAVPGDRPLPVQPFLRCAEDATTRAGALRLSAVQLLLPVQGLDPSSRPAYAPVPSVGTAGWFAERAPHSRTAVTVDISSGSDLAHPAVAQDLAEQLGRLAQGVFTVERLTPARGEGVLRPPFDDGTWNGPDLHGAQLVGQLVEWSCDAIGWLGETVADVVAALGLRSPVLLTVMRTPAPSDRLPPP
jgi:hypothetical protein